MNPTVNELTGKDDKIIYSTPQDPFEMENEQWLFKHKFWPRTYWNIYLSKNPMVRIKSGIEISCGKYNIFAIGNEKNDFT